MLLDVGSPIGGSLFRTFALLLFKWLRFKSYSLVKDLPESVWSNTVHHSENGGMTMDDWLDTYDRHIPDHISQMQTIYDDWVGKIGNVIRIHPSAN